MRMSWPICALCLLAAALLGCGGGATAAPTVQPTEPVAESTMLPVDTPVPRPISTTVATVLPTATPVPTATPTPTAVPVEQRMEGMVLDAVERNPVEIELLRVEDDSGRVWEFVTEGPIGIDAAHLLVHLALGQGVEVVYIEKDGRLVALQVNDLFTQ